ncbi:hypothetical protein SAMN05518855_101993 [Paenibacillus sp. CF384]|nr:hypothetical protein SAMN05518855_101993 [Paenibacillus sp. CF384]
MGVKQMTYTLYISRSWNFNGAYNELEALSGAWEARDKCRSCGVCT